MTDVRKDEGVKDGRVMSDLKYIALRLIAGISFFGAFGLGLYAVWTVQPIWVRDLWMCFVFTFMSAGCYVAAKFIED